MADGATVEAARAPARRALVTGASRGIGAAIARMVAARGYRVTVHGRDTDALATVAASLVPVTDGDHEIAVADLADPAEVMGLAASVARLPLDLLVLNAGLARQAALGETSLELWDETFAVNVRAPFLLIRDLTPALIAAAGRIVIIGSVVSTSGYPLQGAYTASKHALHGLAKVAARELHQAGVRVHTVMPGGVDTDMVRTMRPDLDSSGLISADAIASAVASLLDLGGNGVIDEISVRRAGKEPYSG